MASPLCVTLTVIIIIIISSEVRTTIGVSEPHDADLPNGVEVVLNNNNASSSVPRSTVYSSRCNVQYTMTYGYSRYHSWANFIQFNQSAKGEGMNGATLHFRVRAASDAHILLTPAEFNNAQPVAAGPLYEIVLGAGRNTFCDIRRAQRTGTKANVQLPDVLSGLESRGFWIRMSTDGTLSVGKEGDDAPFIAWHDPNPIQIKYFSFCTWNGVFGKWEYNCPDFVTSPNKTPEIDYEAEAEEKMLDIDRLKKNLLEEYDPFTRPTLNHTDVVTVFLHLHSDMVQVKEAKSSIVVHGLCNLFWIDQKLTWNPDDYGGLKLVRLSTHEIWIPELLLYNAADGRGTDIFDLQRLLTLDYNGTVTWTPRTVLSAICPLNLHLWPFDTHTCPITIGVWAQTEKVTLSPYSEPFSSFLSHSEWELESFTVHDQPFAQLHPHIEEKFYNDVDSDDYLDTNPAIEYTVTVRRKSGVYIWAVYLPIAVSMMFISMSFLMDPKDHRLTFCLINLLIIIVAMMSFFLKFPGATTKCPHIIIIYANGLILSTFSILITALVMTLHEHTFSSAPPAKVMLAIRFLPQILKTLPAYLSKKGKGTSGRRIFQANDHQPLEVDFENKPEDSVSQGEESTQGQWIQLANAIDVVSFFATTLYAIFSF